uniref:Outer membrane channel n=1 Tax=Geobacter metallireducens TaxID=28232 RepID=A0A831UF47_GEOME
MPIKRYIILPALILTALVSFSHSEAGAKIIGDAELGYVGYDAEVDGKKVVSAHSFQQRYSLLYKKDGLLYGGRVGSYDVNLGYEWGSFDTSIKNPSNPADPVGNVNPSISAGHLLYRGEIIVDPRELPMRLKLYSYELNRISFVQDSAGAVAGVSSLVGPGLTTDLLDGLSINTGATLLLGVKSGLTNGYNAIFRHIPLVMVDYRDELRKDTKSATPVDTRLRRLAFVSLNKRDNWFHYRTTRFEDRLDPSGSYTESQLQLGTIDHMLTRRWIDLTNWLKISADGQFTKHSAVNPTNSFEAYDFNIFAMAARKTWEARTFSSLTRQQDRDGLTLERMLPLYANGVLNRDIQWKGSLYSMDRRLRRLDGSESWRNNRNGTLRLDMFSRAPFTLGTFAKVEQSENDGAKLLSFEGGVETASTNRFSRVYSLFAGYNFKYFDASNGLVGSSTYLNQNAIVRVGYTPSQTMRFELEENVSAGSGTNPRDFSNQSIILNSGLSGSSAIRDDFDRRDENVNDYLRSVTTLSGYWTPRPRLRVSAALSEDIMTSAAAPTDAVTTVRGDIDYSLSDFTMRLRGSYRYRNRGGEITDLFDGQGVVEYKPNRSMEASLNYRYSFGHDTPSTMIRFAEVRQRLGYSFYSAWGLARKVLEISEEYDYNRVQNIGSAVTAQTTTQRLTLGARYYPLSRLFVGANARFSLLDPNSVTEQVYNTTVGVNFSKFQASLDYSYGRRNGGDNRIEKRIAANVKKLF